MKTTITGFPRIGEHRELKFATEKYFRGEITEQELVDSAAQIRKRGWDLQAKAGLDTLVANDFSFYDNVLDAAVLFGVIPERYKALGLSETDTYFAMARGYQGEKGNVKALAMKKWFNTNYHYLVPEIEDETEIRLSGEKPLKELQAAKELGYEVRIQLVGPFTFLKLARFCGTKTIVDVKDALVHAYLELFAKLEKEGARWIQLDEAYLVRDLSREEIELFTGIYRELTAKKGSLKLLLQTYFGDVRDVYEELLALDVDGVGLDFVEGKKTAELVKTCGFPKDKVLFAGLVNGKNIWRNHYSDTLKVLDDLKAKGIDTVLTTSCSLLHVPYTLEGENDLSEDYKKHFAFAVEKLEELAELGILAELTAEERAKDSGYLKNLELFTGRKDSVDEAVKARVKAIREEDYTRLPAFSEREKVQKERFDLPLFPTTTIGSFPQTAEVRKCRSSYRKGEISKEEYEGFMKDRIRECIRLQEEIGLDVLVHGEFERNDMVEYFGENLSGYLFTRNAWVQSYGTRCVKPPVIWGDVSRKAPMTVEWSKFAASCTDKPMKGMLTGPVTILNWSFPREDISLKESTLQIALAIRDEVLDLEKSGISIIQIDEAALREKLPLRKSDWYSEYLDWAIPAFRLVHSGVKVETQIHTHMCYSEFTDIIPAIDAMDADVITFEASRSDLLILDALKENNFRTEVGPGVYDIHSPRVPSVEELTEALGKMLQKVEKKSLW
ncbi:MAG: 5-methyltetrahydropteroyltriglutamate--homocysteine S-methyltransferase, partial [Lachnospiraceae bacterium]|nr:5-methyltetrahydropteroyltriglutamate--homocysteine S-methyltransferase [Lachnospiraceae bacterium]